MKNSLSRFFGTLLVAIFLFNYLLLNAKGNSSNIDTNGKSAPNIELLKSTDSEIIIKVSANSYNLQKVIINNVLAYSLTAPEAFPILKKGAPNIPKLSTSVIIPDMAKMEIEIVSSKYQDIEGINIAPSKGNIYRNINQNDVNYFYGAEYTRNEFYPYQLASLGKPYIVRDVRGEAVNFYPYQYNPVTKTLRVYKEMVVKISRTNQSGENIKTRNQSFDKISVSYKNIYNRLFINYKQVQEKYNPVEEEGNMVIIAHSDYLSLMQPLVDWKKQKGINCELVEFSTIGSSANAIKNYLADYYNNNGLTFVLLVGDADKIPSLYKSGDSDNAYAYVEGNDSYPEFFVGRFSGQSESNITTQVNRVINYEKNPESGAEWYSTNIVIGSEQGAGEGDEGEADYEHMQNIRADLMAYTYAKGYELYDGSQGGEDESGNPSSGDLGNALNSGSGFLAYVGHGSDYSFVTTGFSINNVNALTNDNMLPFIFDVACVNGNFHNQTCFAEAWMRATNGENPTGAIAIIASTINQSWAPPMAGQDEMVDILVDSYSDNIKHTFGGITMNGCMFMNDKYGTNGAEMTDTWTIFGDPSLVVRTKAPDSMAISHNPVLFIGTTELQINCDAENSLAVLTFNNEIAGKAKVVNGSAVINYDAFTTVGEVTLTVTGYNKVPYIVNIDIVPQDGAFVVLNDYTITDDNNNQADYDEEISLNLSFKNVGNKMAGNVTATLLSNDDFVSITDSTALLGNIDSSSTVSLNNLFAVKTDSMVPDAHVAQLQLILKDELDSIWTSGFSIQINAPKLSVGQIVFDDENGGNNNKRMDAGEVLNLKMQLQNIGNADSKNATLLVSTRSENIAILQQELLLGIISEKGIIDTSVTIIVNPLTPIGNISDLTFTVTAGQYTATKTVSQTIGFILEDFEKGDFSSFAWDTSYTKSWFISNVAYEGAYAAQSVDVENSEKAEFSIELDVTADDTISFFRKVSSEENYDYFEFYIDGFKQAQWSGEVDWSEEKFEVNAGHRTFKWVYSKDYVVDDGLDCAWVDYIKLPGYLNDSTPVGNDTLQFVSQADTSGQVNEVYNYTVEVTSSSNNSELEFMCYTKPEWLTLTDNGNGKALLSGTPDNNEYLWDNNVIVCVTNGVNSAYQMFDIYVQPAVKTEDINRNQPDLSIYPNPVQDNAVLNITLQKSKKVEISIINILGKKVKETESLSLNARTNSYPLNVSGLSSGIYFINVITGNKSYSIKFIKK
ncbi:MAG: T9SS type A sorting domain-containing protein [Chlorobi bacterium]|nr:T9SS type A sorting domain-containing protein [Chlorobiota bacterium]